jgi:hypothetical protein
MQHTSSTGHSVMTMESPERKGNANRALFFNYQPRTLLNTQKQNVLVRIHKAYFYSCGLQVLHIHLFTCLFNGAVSISKLQFRMTGRL